MREVLPTAPSPAMQIFTFMISVGIVIAPCPRPAVARIVRRPSLLAFGGGGRPAPEARVQSSPGGAAGEARASSPPPGHPPEAARQERFEARPRLVQARDPAVPVNERRAMGFLQGALRGLQLREEIARA